MANIETLFAKMTAPGQRRVSYGVYWAVNKMKNCGTKSTERNGVRTFVQWISYRDAEFIMPKLMDFDRLNGRKSSTTDIDGDRVAVCYWSGGINGNVRIDITWCNADDLKKSDDAKKAIEDAKKEIEEKKLEITRHMVKYIRSMNGNCTREQYDAEMERAFGTEMVNLLDK
jgi:hypothetical protein